MAAPTEAEEPVEIGGPVSSKGRAEVRIVGDRSAKAIRGLIRLLTMHAELMEETEAEERAMAAEEPRERAGEDG